PDGIEPCPSRWTSDAVANATWSIPHDDQYATYACGRRRASCFRGQVTALRLREHQRGEDDEAIGDTCENADRLTQRQRCAQQADERRIQCRNPSTEIIGKALPGASDTRREIFSQKSAHSRKNPVGKKSEGKSEHQHQCVVDRKLRVDKYGDERAYGVKDKIRAPSDAIGQVGPADQAAERTEYHDP